MYSHSIWNDRVSKSEFSAKSNSLKKGEKVGGQRLLASAIRADII